QNLVFKLLRQKGRQSLGADTLRPTVGIGGGNEGDVEQAALEGIAPCLEMRDRERAKRIAVPGALTRDEATAALYATRRVVLERDLQAGFDRFRTARHIDDIGEMPAGIVGDDLGQLFHRIRGEEIA